MIGEFWDYGKGSSRRVSHFDDRPIRLLLVEDRRGSLEALADYLRRQAGIQIDATSDSGLLAGVRAIFDKPDVVLVSADLVGFTARDTVRLIRQLTPSVSVLLLGQGAQLHRWRDRDCPDAVLEQPDDYEAIVDLIRSLRARTEPGAGAAMQTRHPRDFDTH